MPATINLTAGIMLIMHIEYAHYRKKVSVLPASHKQNNLELAKIAYSYLIRLRL